MSLDLKNNDISEINKSHKSPHKDDCNSGKKSDTTPLKTINTLMVCDNNFTLSGIKKSFSNNMLNEHAVIDTLKSDNPNQYKLNINLESVIKTQSQVEEAKSAKS